jgi:hypothetical protein
MRLQTTTELNRARMSRQPVIAPPHLIAASEASDSEEVTTATTLLLVVSCFDFPLFDDWCM